MEKSSSRHCKGSLEAKVCLLLHPLAADRRDLMLGANSMEGDSTSRSAHKEKMQEKRQVCGMKPWVAARKMVYVFNHPEDSQSLWGSVRASWDGSTTVPWVIFLFTPTDALCNNPPLPVTACHSWRNFPFDGCPHAGGELWGFQYEMATSRDSDPVCAVF